MRNFMTALADAFGSYDDREDTAPPGLNTVAAEFGITALKARKLLITAGVYSTALSRRIKELHSRKMKMDQIMSATGLSRASVHSYLPYTKIPYNLEWNCPSTQSGSGYIGSGSRNAWSSAPNCQLCPDNLPRSRRRNCGAC